MTGRLTARIAAAALAVLAFGHAAAQSVPARLAATEGDRRFVLDVAPPNGWKVQQFADLVEIRFPGFAADIALPTAIRPPVADLATEIRDGDTLVRFTISCDCTPVLATRGAGSLTIDFVETVADDAPAPLRAPIPARRRAGTSGTPDATTPGAAADVDVAEARERLMKQLLRAAEAGLIEIDGADRAPAADDRERPAGAAGAGGDGPARTATSWTGLPAAAVTPGRAGPERAAGGTGGTGGDGASHAAGEAARPPAGADAPGDADSNADSNTTAAAPEAICHAAATFDLPRRDSGAGWVESVGRLRAEMIGEFDRPNQAAVLDLARTYLSAGLADEALAVLADFGAGTAKAVVLAEVARVIAGSRLAEGASVLRDDCLGPQAMWRALALANAGDAQAAMAAEEAAGRALEKLPPALRADIGARLGLAAADAGQWDSARRLQALIGRIGRDHAETGGWPHLLAARLAQWADDEAGTIRSLTAARAADPEVAIRATLMLADLVLATGETRRDGLSQLITDLGLLARLHRGTDAGARAAALEVRLTERQQGRAKAIDLLTLGLALGDFSEATFTETLSAIAEGGDASARDSIAAIYLEDRAAFDPALADPGFRAVLARSLIGLGLPAQAAALYADGVVPPRIATELVEGFLGVGDYRSAIAMIADLPDSAERERLRRVAMAQAGHPVPDATAAGDPPDGAQLVALARAAIAAGDLRRALDLTLQRVRRDGGTGAAETAALLALAAGRAELPEEAIALLKKGDPALHDRLAKLLGDPPAPIDPNDPATAAAYLERLDAEISVIEEVLGDG